MSLRSDAARNRAAIVEAARRLFQRDGATASLEEIARTAGVGSATLHRHFRSRQALLDVVFIDDVERLCAEGELMAADESDADAVWRWLEHVAVHCAADDRLSAVIRQGGASPESQTRSFAMLAQAGQRLLARARVRDGTSITDLLIMVNAIAIAAASKPADVPRLVALVREGAAPPSPDGEQTPER